MPDAPTRVMFSELEDEGIEPYEVPNLLLSSNEPDTYVDITDTIDTGSRRSLSTSPRKARRRPRGCASVRAPRGEEAGVEYAEAFKAFRFSDDDE